MSEPDPSDTPLGSASGEERQEVTASPIQRAGRLLRAAVGAARGTAGGAARELEFESEEGEEETEVPEAKEEEEESPPLPPIQESEQEVEEVEQNQGANTMSTSTSSTTYDGSRQATVAENVGEMFKAADPVDENKLRPACKRLRSERGDNPKDIGKVEALATASIEQKFDTPKYLFTNKMGEPVAEDTSFFDASVPEQFLRTAVRAQAVQKRVIDYDMTNITQIPVLRVAEYDPAKTPADRWDFTQRRDLFDHIGSISMKECEFWTEDCLRWAKEKFDPQDQQWLKELLSNSCTFELQQVVDERFAALPVKRQGGVTYAKILFDTLYKLDDKVVLALQKRFKMFEEKGPALYHGENIRTAKLELVTIATRLDEVNRLPEDTVNQVLDGLSKASHVEFSRTFSEFKRHRGNSLLSIGKLSGTPCEQIKQIFTEAFSQYEAYTLGDEWNFPGASGAAYVSCHNCGGPHIVPECKQPRDEARIKRNREAFLKAKQQSGGGGGGGRGRGNGGGRPPRGGGAGRGGGGRSNTTPSGYSRGAFGPPKKNEVVRTIKKQVYCACNKGCGWTTGDKAHSSGGHDAFMAGNYVMPESHPYKQALAARANSQSQGGGSGGGTNAGNGGGSGGGGSEEQQMKAFCSYMSTAFASFEKETSNPSLAEAGGVFKSIFGKMGGKE